MKRFMTKKVVAIGLTTGLTLGIAGVAFAYFTSTGSGPGTASVGTNTAVVITQTNTVSGLIPGGLTVAVAYTIANPTGNGAQNLGTVSLAIGTLPTGCTAADFTLTTSASAVGTIANGATYTSVAGTEPTIQMKETGANQDACKNATVPLTINAALGT